MISIIEQKVRMFNMIHCARQLCFYVLGIGGKIDRTLSTLAAPLNLHANSKSCGHGTGMLPARYVPSEVRKPFQYVGYTGAVVRLRPRYLDGRFLWSSMLAFETTNGWCLRTCAYTSSAETWSLYPIGGVSVVATQPEVGRRNGRVSMIVSTLQTICTDSCFVSTILWGIYWHGQLWGRKSSRGNSCCSDVDNQEASVHRLVEALCYNIYAWFRQVNKIRRRCINISITILLCRKRVHVFGLTVRLTVHDRLTTVQ